MSVQDLTNTTWIIDDEPTSSIDSEGSIGWESLLFDINFTSNQTNYTSLSLYCDYQTSLDISYNNIMVWNGWTQDGRTPPPSWTNVNYKTIEITGGDDVNDETLIGWLEANATQQGGSQLMVDLTSLSGWNSLTAGTTYALTVKAKATGYRDSIASYPPVSFTKPVEGYIVSVAPNYSYTDNDGEYYGFYVSIDGVDTYLIDVSPGQVLSSSASQVTFYKAGGGGSYITYTMGGVSYPDISTGIPINLTGDLIITSAMSSCLTGDTLITLADNSTKRLDEIEVSDYVLSYDWETLTKIPRKVIFTDKDAHKTYTEYDVWTFDNGSTIKTVHRHEFYNAEAKRFKYMDEWQIGEHAVTIDGTLTALVSHETIKEEIQHYKITLEGSTNYFANGLLTGDRNCPKNIVFNNNL